MPTTEPKLVVVIDDILDSYHRHDQSEHRSDHRTIAAFDLFSTLGSFMRHAHALGVHFLLTAQVIPRNAAAVLDVTNADYRVDLRTETAEDSRDVIGSTAAHELPTSAGRGLFCTKRGTRIAEPAPFRGFQVSRDLVRSVGRQFAASGRLAAEGSSDASQDVTASE